jgi:hypothetical protein
MKRIMIIGGLFLVFFASCNKDNNPNDKPEADSVLDYMPLAIGNYWVYETFSCDSGGVNCVSQSVDTTQVTGDTVMNGNTYFKLEGSFELFPDQVFLRDSGDYLVNQQGIILFTCSDSLHRFNEHEIIGQDNDTLFYWYTKLFLPASPVLVGSGSYDCLDFRTLLFRKQDNFQTAHQTHHYYAKNIGLIKETSLWAISLKEFHRELIGYGPENR